MNYSGYFSVAADFCERIHRTHHELDQRRSKFFIIFKFACLLLLIRTNHFSSNFWFDVADHHFNTFNLALVFSPRKRRSRCDRHRGDRRRSRCDRQRGDRRRSGWGGCFDFLQFIDALLDSCNFALVIFVVIAPNLRGANIAIPLSFVVMAHNSRGANLAITLSFVVIAHK